MYIISQLGLASYIAFKNQYFGSSTDNYLNLFVGDLQASVSNLDYFLRNILIFTVGLGVFSIFIIFFTKPAFSDENFKPFFYFGVLNFFVSIIFGAAADTDRYLTVSGILFTSILICIISQIKTNLIWFPFALFSTFILWEPFMYRFEDELSFEQMFARRWMDPTIVLSNSYIPIVFSLILFGIALITLFIERKSRL